MRIEIINTGSELLLGRVLNTHQQWLCRHLSDRGYLVGRQTAVPDSGSAIQEAVRDALARADLVITTGGLGPTSDDRTRELIATLLGLRLIQNDTVLEDITQFFARRHRAMPAHTGTQAMIPDGAIVFRNAWGTAPGLAIRVPPSQFRQSPQESWLIMLPGPPNELRPMFLEQAMPLIRKSFPLEQPFACRILKTTGIGESQAENMVMQPLQAMAEAGLELGYCARPGEVDIRLTAQGAEAESLVTKADQIVRNILGEYIFGSNDEELPEVVIGLLAARKQTLAVAESCTGGNLAHRLTNVPGASAVFLGGWITYHNLAKERFLGVMPETLATHGAVSEQTAREMAEGARQRMGSDYALSITGIAGPSGGSEAKPVGTVYIGLASPRETRVIHRFNPQGREVFKYVTTQQALELLRESLLRQP